MSVIYILQRFMKALEKTRNMTEEYRRVRKSDKSWPQNGACKQGEASLDAVGSSQPRAPQIAFGERQAQEPSR